MSGELVEIQEFVPVEDSADLRVEIYAATPRRVHLAGVVVLGTQVILQFPDIVGSPDVSLEGFLDGLRRAAAIGHQAAAAAREGGKEE
jgi:hypothetical protein